MKFRPTWLLAIIFATAWALSFWLARPLLAAELVMPEGLKNLPYQAALVEASQNKKNIMLYFWADWCPSCQDFNSRILPNKDVLQSLADSFSVVSVNTGVDPDNLSEKFKIRAIPAFIFLDSQGEPISMLPGAVEADVFTLVLKFISSGSYNTMEFEDFAKLSAH
ncbi:MAG: thioredoxin fold domain-containing protein [Deltaproteobacteria bacterium]|jgi:thioredoxin-related protein|nr:thioredoxin fold domain-containing protein [Deltaproteobacteria bacterium]